MFEGKIKVSFDKYEETYNKLMGMDYENLVIEDIRDLDEIMNTLMVWDEVEEELLKARKNIDYIIIKVYTEDRIEELVKEFNAEVKEVKEEDWANNWKQYYKPIKISDKIIIKPSWENYEKNDSEMIVELDPGMAFGTGGHETTSMCIRLLEKYLTNEMSVIDVGCGSGILSIVASKLGAKEVFAVDLDDIAVKASNENIALNNIKNIEVVHGNLLDMTNKKADIVVANIVAEVIMMLNKNIKNHINENGTYIMSGIINQRLDEVIASLTDFNILEVINDGNWNAIVVKVK